MQQREECQPRGTPSGRLPGLMVSKVTSARSLASEFMLSWNVHWQDSGAGPSLWSHSRHHPAAPGSARLTEKPQKAADSEDSGSPSPPHPSINLLAVDWIWFYRWKRRRLTLLACVFTSAWESERDPESNHIGNTTEHAVLHLQSTFEIAKIKYNNLLKWKSMVSSSIYCSAMLNQM